MKLGRLVLCLSFWAGNGRLWERGTGCDWGRWSELMNTKALCRTVGRAMERSRPVRLRPPPPQLLRRARSTRRKRRRGDPARRRSGRPRAVSKSSRGRPAPTRFHDRDNHPPEFARKTARSGREHDAQLGLGDRVRDFDIAQWSVTVSLPDWRSRASLELRRHTRSDRREEGDRPGARRTASS